MDDRNVLAHGVIHFSRPVEFRFRLWQRDNIVVRYTRTVHTLWKGAVCAALLTEGDIIKVHQAEPRRRRLSR